jgi:hypothetical protein
LTKMFFFPQAPLVTLVQVMSFNAENLVQWKKYKFVKLKLGLIQFWTKSPPLWKFANNMNQVSLIVIYKFVIFCRSFQ